MRLNKNIIYLAIFSVATAFMQSCSENIDTSARYTATDPTVVEYLESDTMYRDYVELLKKVKINSRLARASSVYKLLSARGIYTVFAPTNTAIKNYFDSLRYQAGKELDDSTVLAKYQEQVVLNSIIDKGDTDGEVPYRLSDFSEGELGYSNLNERRITVLATGGGFIVNGQATIDPENSDIYAINGRIHTVNGVVAPSDETASEYFSNELEKKEGSTYRVMAALLDVCGIMDTLSKTEDMDYYDRQHGDNPIPDIANRSVQSFGTIPGVLPDRRRYGFTVFAEPDTYWQSVLTGGIPDSEEDIAAKVQDYIVNNGLSLSSAVADESYTSNDNALRQFVCYHVLPEKLTSKNMVVHFNELGYDPTQTVETLKDASCSVADYYACIYTDRLMKLFESARSRKLMGGHHGIFINRFPTIDNARTGTGEELSCDDTPYTTSKLQSKEGNYVHADDGQYVELENARIYTIDGVLGFSSDVQDELGSHRIRIEAASLFPELMNNSIRAKDSQKAADCCVGIPVTSDYNYLENCKIENGSAFYYLSGRQQKTSVWGDYQGDEINVKGKYELRVKLPPVPKSGTWEVRYGYQTPANAQRGMCQVYFGTNKESLPSAGIPLDLRMGGEYRYISNGTLPSILTWNQDEFGDDVEEINAETDKQLRNQGYMKGPRCFFQFSFDEYSKEDVSGQTNIARYEQRILRKIIITKTMKDTETYYIKFKNVLDDTDKEFYFDFLEFCPKSVYNNPTTPEDVW